MATTEKKSLNVQVQGWVIQVFGLVLIVLKLAGVITVSWWLVLAPFWIPMTLLVLAVLVLGAIKMDEK